MLKACLNIAKYPDRLYGKYIAVLAMYEDGSTVGQKLKPSERHTKPQPRPDLLLDLTKLKQQDQVTLLGDVEQMKSSLNEMFREVAVLRKLDVVQRSFCQLTGCIDGGWEEAVAKFPNYANRETLEQFLKLSYSRGIPEQLTLYCRRLTLLKEHKDLTERFSTFALNGAYGFVVNSDVEQIHYNLLKEHCPGFNGLDLAIIDLVNVSIAKFYSE